MFRLIIALGVSYALYPTIEKNEVRELPTITAPIVETPNVSALDTLGAVNSVVQDFSGFCARNEAACDTGNALISKAHNVAKSTIDEIIADEAKNRTAVAETVSDE